MIIDYNQNYHDLCVQRIWFEIKMVQEQWLQLKIKFLLSYNMKIVIKWGGGVRWGGGNLWQWHIQSFFGQPSTQIKSMIMSPWLAPRGKIFKVCSSRYSRNALPGSVCSVLCKTLSKLLKLLSPKTPFCGWFLKKSYIQIKELYSFKLLGAAKWSVLA